MINFVLRRLFETVVLLFSLSVLIFVLLQLIPGDYLSEMELNPAIPRERVEELRREYGLEEPFYTQYVMWGSQVVRGNLGYSFAQRRPAWNLIRERFGNTLILTISAFTLTLLFSLPVGVVAAWYAGHWPDRLSLFLSLLGLSFPAVLSSLSFLYLAFWTGWFPIGGVGGLSYLVLPSLTLALPTAAFFVRNLRLEMIDALGQPYVMAAAAKGLSPPRVAFHALKNALNPLISLMGITLGGLLSGAVVVEKVFNWPGLGALAVDSILSRDLFVVLNCLLVAAFLIVIANLLADLVLAWNDPRIRYR